MKFKKSSLLVVAGMAVLLAGCGNQSASTNGKKADNTPKTEAVKRAVRMIKRKPLMINQRRIPTRRQPIIIRSQINR